MHNLRCYDVLYWLSSGDTQTFVWLFEAWLTCTLNRQPKAIVTDRA
jgi:hypothetical protein